jgi:hypothetical protein
MNVAGMNCAIPRGFAVCALALLLPCATAGLVVAAGPISETDTPASPFLDVRVERSLLTVDVREVPLARLLRTIGERAGVDVVIRGDLGLVTESFHGLPLEEGIRRLARGHSLAVTYSGAEEGPGVASVDPNLGHGRFVDSRSRRRSQ